MKKKLSRRTIRILIPLISVLIVIVGTIIAIRIGQGYRPTTNGIAGTGLLAANSFPPGAEVYINDKLTSATDDTLSLPPGDYKIRLEKEGYLTWQKDLKVQVELVTQTNATLFRSVPSLSPLTLTGASLTTPSPDGQKIAFVVTNAPNPAKNGLYVLELSNNLPIVATREPRQITRLNQNPDSNTLTLLWSPDSLSLLIRLSDETTSSSNYLLPTDKFSEFSELTDVTARLPIILNQWEEEITSRETKQFATLPLQLQAIATQSAVNVYFSPKEDKVLYTSTEYITLPQSIIAAPPASSTQPEYRDLEPGGIYVYDLEEDKNFKIGSIELNEEKPVKRLLIAPNQQQIALEADRIASASNTTVTRLEGTLQHETDFKITESNFNTHYSSIHTLPVQWYPNSTHLIIIESDRIDTIEYDATNRNTIYSGPFENAFTYPWPDGSRLIVLTNLNPTTDSTPNLYGIQIR